jgi:DNA-binding GntR family transcriptional regulator
MVTLKSGSTRNGREQERVLVDAALARDAKTASRILCTHIDDSAAAILRQLQDRL